MIILIAIGVLVVLIGAVIASGFVSASPGEIKVISGPRGQRVIHGKTGWKFPIIERVDKMTAQMITSMLKLMQLLKLELEQKNLSYLKLLLATSCTKHLKKSLLKFVTHWKVIYVLSLVKWNWLPS